MPTVLFVWNAHFFGYVTVSLGGNCSLMDYIQVHRFLLARDSSAFENMFSMPHGEPADRSPEGYSDSNPIVLEGESACDFAELLTVLYAL